MSFRRDGKSTHAERRSWEQWLSGVSELAATAELPPSILGSEEAWWYFVDRTYSQAGYLGEEPWYSIDSLTDPQRSAIRQLLSRWLKERWPDAPSYKIQSLQVTYGLDSTNT